MPACVFRYSRASVVAGEIPVRRSCMSRGTVAGRRVRTLAPYWKMRGSTASRAPPMGKAPPGHVRLSHGKENVQHGDRIRCLCRHHTGEHHGRDGEADQQPPESFNRILTGTGSPSVTERRRPKTTSPEPGADTTFPDHSRAYRGTRTFDFPWLSARPPMRTPRRTALMLKGNNAPGERRPAAGRTERAARSTPRRCTASDHDHPHHPSGYFGHQCSRNPHQHRGRCRRVARGDLS